MNPSPAHHTYGPAAERRTAARVENAVRKPHACTGHEERYANPNDGRSLLALAGTRCLQRIRRSGVGLRCHRPSRRERSARSNGGDDCRGAIWNGRGEGRRCPSSYGFLGDWSKMGSVEDRVKMHIFDFAAW